MIDKEIIIRRLATIKYLFSISVQQSMQVEAVAGFSILSFHDCAEMFLLLVAENKGITTKDISFMGFWNKCPELTLKESMNALKDIRVSIKHKGQFPSKQDIEISRITMTSFMEQNTPIQFGIDFKDVSISNLISFDIVREHIDKAESFYNDGNLYECLVNSKIAFLELLSSYENNKKGKYSCDSLLNIGDHIGKDFQKLVGTNDNDGARWFKQVTDSTNQIREILKIIALGIDFKKYTYFEAITPTIQSWWKDGLITHEAWPKNLFEERNHLRKIDCRFCIDFVIDSSLKLQEFDYDINNIIK